MFPPTFCPTHLNYFYLLRHRALFYKEIQNLIRGLIHIHTHIILEYLQKAHNDNPQKKNSYVYDETFGPWLRR